MSILITAIIVLLAAGLLIYAVRAIPGIPAPIPAVVTVLILLAAAVFLLSSVGVVAI